MLDPLQPTVDIDVGLVAGGGKLKRGLNKTRLTIF